jgi:hypothetical protein
MITLGRGVSAWWLRVAVLLTGAGVLAIPMTEGVNGALAVIVALGVAGSVYAPASPAPALVVLGGAAMLVLADADPLRPVVLAMIPTAHLFHVCCGIAGVLPIRGRLHLRALRRPAVRFLSVQAAVFVLAGVAALLPTDRNPVVVEIAGLVAVVVLAGVILAVHRERSHTRGGGRSTR